MDVSPTSWWQRRSLWPELSVPDLLALKGSRTVSVLVPARNEQATVEGVVRPLVQELLAAGLVEEVLVIDGRSTDGTGRAATAAGARVLELPEHASGYDLAGKGGALWWGQQQAKGDLLVFLDADVVPSRAATAARLLTPLLLDPEVSFVKAAFDRPLTIDGVLHHGSGGRVTELLARPVLNAWWPELAGFVQPLAGELAVRGDLLAKTTFTSGYGLEIAMLIDVLAMVGIDAMAQADIGVRHHRHHSDVALGRMSAEVLAAALDRHGEPAADDRMVQFTRQQHGFAVRTSFTGVTRLPAADSLQPEPAS